MRRQRVDVLIADIAMPGEDGYAFIRQVRAMESVRGPTIPAMALTSFTHEGDRQPALEAGFQVHLSKPIESRVLVQAIAAIAFRTASP